MHSMIHHATRTLLYDTKRGRRAHATVESSYSNHTPGTGTRLHTTYQHDTIRGKEALRSGRKSTSNYAKRIERSMIEYIILVFIIEVANWGLDSAKTPDAMLH